MALQSNLISIAVECILEKKSEIIALVIDQQYNEGVDSAGEPLRQYSKQYEYEKSKLGLYRGHTDFNLSGEMHGEMNIAVVGDEYIIESSATTDKGERKTEWLTKWQRAPIMELTAENKVIAAEIIRPLFMEKAEGLMD